jgi:hypothetical protein
MDFFSDRFAYPVCGMYSLGHFIFVLIIGILIVLGVNLSKNLTK